MMWMWLAAAFLFLLGLFLWALWRREARSAGRSVSGGIGIPLIVILIAAAGYILVGRNEHTGDWLVHQHKYGDAARFIVAGKAPEMAAADIPAGAMARVLQSQLSRTPSATGWFALGSLYAQLGAPAQTEEAARKSLALDPDSATSHLLLARALIEKTGGKLNEAAREELQWVLDREPNHDGAWMMLTMSADRAGQYDLAISGWESLLARHGDGETGDLLRRGLENSRQQKAREGVFASLTAQVEGKGLPPGGTLFVYIREQGSAGQPLAARRQVVPSFPATVSLTAENWLQAYPPNETPLVMGARYTPAPGAAVDQAMISAPAVPLQLPQKVPAELVLSAP
ncbi:tetratricopeptide repeat protein [Alcanivorax sediminis]|uniref:Cytochrome C biogenesis protein n=1 Tax=Alcanivorax sediminis TaxID=2663008 RepID=A0A6N7LW34_9GAMM|nr:cytochrome C biogenesis protein [Alcanivorax sediminis]MQX53394.1 cytochrome C biogenesis protein [Alcanivorax sediminis]